MRKYYKFLLSRLLVLCVIYITVFTIITYTVSLMYTRNILIRDEQTRADRFADNLNQIITHCMDITNGLSSNPSVISYFQSGDDTYATAVQQQLSALTPQNIYPVVFAVVNPEKNSLITPNGTESLEAFIRNSLISQNKATSIIENLQKNNNSDYCIDFTFNNEKNSYITSYISYKTNFGKPIIFIGLYDFNKLKDSIPKSNIECMVNFKINNGSVNSAYNEILGQNIENPDYDKLKYKLIAESTTNSYYLDSITCSIYAPYISYLVHINNFLFLFVLVILVLLFAGLLYAKKNADKMYMPVQKLLTSFPVDAESINSGEFEALESHFSSLTSKESTMTNIITNNKRQLEDNFLLQLVTSTMTKDEISEGQAVYNLDNNISPLQVFILSYRNFFELMDILSPDGLNDAKRSIHEHFNAAYASSKFFKILDIDQQTMVIITQVKDSESFINSLKKNILTIEMLFDINLVAFAGKPSASWDKISSSYTDALYLKNKCMITSDQNIVISSLDNENISVEYSSDIENKFISSVISGNLSAAVENINVIVDKNMNINFLSHEHYTHFITMLYSTFIRILTNINKTEKQVFDNVSIYLELISCADSASLKATLTEVTSKIIACIMNTEKDSNDTVANRMITYIHENYTSDISLFTIAEHLNLSQSYTSRFFKAQTGENFKDYLMNFRLEKAVEIMTNTPNMKLSHVASAVGLTQKTFYRAFMKKYNTAPSNYIK